MLLLLGAAFISVSVIVLDIFKIVDFAYPRGFILSGIVLPHVVLISYLFYAFDYFSTVGYAVFCVLLFSLYSYFFWRMHVLPFRKNKKNNTRVCVMMGGRLLIIYSIWALFFQIIIYGIHAALYFNDRITIPGDESTVTLVLWSDFAWCFCTVLGLMFNGVLRVVFFSRQLGIAKRVICIVFMFTPLVQLYIFSLLSRTAKEEYDNELCRYELRLTRAGSEICKTRYPIVLVHGVGFRDNRFFNYWGRIPRELTLNGASVYYGHQDGWAVIEDNGPVIKKTIEQAMEECKTDKVNIIAHSKGGLDSRYVINGLGMQEHVASLTTICTPHRGSELIPVLRKLPEGLYRFICSCLNKIFKTYGDTRPDVYLSSLQLHPDYCREFNEKYPDCPGIYYQSYASAMKSPFSNSILFIPYIILKKAAGPVNDGLVQEKSAMWGEFKGTFKNDRIRGISHGDMIDLQREDFKHFDVIESYVNIAADLKNRGF